jgi:hypothetical protein
MSRDSSTTSLITRTSLKAKIIRSSNSAKEVSKIKTKQRNVSSKHQNLSLNPN